MWQIHHTYAKCQPIGDTGYGIHRDSLCYLSDKSNIQKFNFILKRKTTELNGKKPGWGARTACSPAGAPGSTADTVRCHFNFLPETDLKGHLKCQSYSN